MPHDPKVAGAVVKALWNACPAMNNVECQAAATAALDAIEAIGWVVVDDSFLRTLIDLTWGEAMEDQSVPRSRTQTQLILRAMVAARPGAQP